MDDEEKQRILMTACMPIAQLAYHQCVVAQLLYGTPLPETDVEIRAVITRVMETDD